MQSGGIGCIRHVSQARLGGFSLVLGHTPFNNWSFTHRLFLAPKCHTRMSLLGPNVGAIFLLVRQLKHVVMVKHFVCFMSVTVSVRTVAECNGLKSYTVQSGDGRLWKNHTVY